MKKLVVVISHPIQYYSPLFTSLAKQCNLMVYYTLDNHSKDEILDEGFGKKIKWDLPLLENYNYSFIENVAARPGHHFNGIKNPELIKKIGQFKPHAILIYGWAYHSHLKVMRHFKGKIPVWFRGDSTLIDTYPVWRKVIRTVLLKWVYQYIDTAFYVGSQNKAYFKAFGLNESQLVFAPHAIDNERFGENRVYEALALRRKLEIAEDEILILFAGKFEEKKDPLILLNAFIKLNKPGSHLLFVGNGHLEKMLKSSASDSLQKGAVHFIDFQNQSQMPVVYQACDLFCLPSKGPCETWGLAVNEAMAAGKAILISDKVGCSTDLVFKNKNGFIFTSESIKELIFWLKKFIENPPLVEKFGKSSKKIIENWSFENATETMLSKLNS